MDSLREMEALGAHAGRSAGSDAERRAAKHLQGRLRALGRDAELQPIDVRPRFALAHALHCLIAIAGSVVAVSNAPLGAALVLFALLATALDAGGGFQLVRRITGRRASQNVESREPAADKPGLLLLVAHYDAGRLAPAFARLARVLRDPFALIVAAMLVLLACCAARSAGLESGAVTAVQFVPTVMLILLTPLLVDLELSPAGRGAADNASGVITVLRLAEDLGGSLEHFEVRVLLTGAQKPFAVGMRRWLRANRGALDSERTVVLNVDRVGSGGVRFARREGPLVPRRTHSELLRLCREIAEDDAGGSAFAASEQVVHEASDASAVRTRGLPAITVSCSGDGAAVEPEALDRAHAFCRELAERLDAEVGPRLRR